MGFGKWTRYGAGACEGYALEIGSLLRFDVTTKGHAGADPNCWFVSRGTVSLGNFPTFEAAIARAEQEARGAMQEGLAHWEAFGRQPPAARRSGRQRR
jgi:hypothetical protein